MMYSNIHVIDHIIDLDQDPGCDEKRSKESYQDGKGITHRLLDISILSISYHDDAIKLDMFVVSRPFSVKEKRFFSQSTH